jgi:hypothetical protein
MNTQEDGKRRRRRGIQNGGRKTTGQATGNKKCGQRVTWIGSRVQFDDQTCLRGCMISQKPRPDGPASALQNSRPGQSRQQAGKLARPGLAYMGLGLAGLTASGRAGTSLLVFSASLNNLIILSAFSGVGKECSFVRVFMILLVTVNLYHY